MFEGSLYGHWEAIVTFQQLIVLADREGYVDMTPQALAARTSIPLEIITAGIDHLLQADPFSRTPDCGGRRLEPIDPARPWGWRIVNYAKYREMVTAAEKRAADRERIAQRRRAEKLSTGEHSSPRVAARRKVSQPVANVAHADADAEVDADADADAGTDNPLGLQLVAKEPDPVEVVFQHWQQVHGHPRAALDRKRRRTIERALEGYSADDLCRCITGYLSSPHHMGENDRGTRYDAIELFLRDAQHIDAGLRFAQAPPDTRLSRLTQANVDRTEDWRPPELRGDGHETC
jgi:hypothetical protein